MSRGLPALTVLWDEFADQRERFAIVALHDASVPDLATLDEKLRTIVAGPWRGRELPFPIVLDDGGETFEAYGVRAYPTEVLVDPEGRVVKGGEARLREILEAQR